MSHENKIVVRCRAVIINNGKLLVVKHTSESKFYALPGGHLEWGEGIKECMTREIIEELGVHPKLGRLLYVNTFIDKIEKIQSVEFFFEVVNGGDYVDIQNNVRSHAYEIVELRWIGPKEDVRVLPKKIADDFSGNIILSDVVRYNIS